MNICENCSSLTDGNYGSGRFCSTKCARGFSTKLKRKEINEKISAKLSGRGNGPVHKKCIVCELDFNVPYGKRDQLHCSPKCGKITVGSDPNYIKKMSDLRIKSILIGNVNGAGIKCKFIFNDREIPCDSKLEYASLLFFTNNYNVLDIQRSSVWIEYIYDDKIHRYNPDFLITTDMCTFIVECKSTKVSTDLRKKWQTYIKLTEVKKQLLKEYAEQNDYVDFWFTEKTYKGYKTLRIKIVH